MDQCPICGSSCKKLKESRRCQSCGVVRTDFNYNSHIYGSEYADNYLSYQRTQVNIPLNLFRLGLISRWLKHEDPILDIGCCIGEFIRFAEQYYECYGFEPNHSAAEIAIARVNYTKVKTELNGSIPKVKLITMFDVFEHIEDPHSFLETLTKSYLQTDGIIVLTTPNAGCIPLWDDMRLQSWKHYKPKEHLYLYTERSLVHLFGEYGFELIHVGLEESDIRPGNLNGDILTFVARRMTDDFA